jgi:hypothetical protein
MPHWFSSTTRLVPTIVTTTARDSMWGPTFPELVSALPDTKIIDQSTVNAWDEPKVAAAIEALTHPVSYLTMMNSLLY